MAAARASGSALALSLTVAALLGAAPPAHGQAAQFGVESFTGMVFADDLRDRTDAYSNTGDPGGRITDSYPDPSTGGTGIYDLAGGHPFIGVTDFSFNRTEPGGPPAGGNVSGVRVDIPRGLMPNPGEFDRCTEAELIAHSCPLSSQIGTEELVLYIGAVHGLVGDITLKVPLYNMTPLNDTADLPRRDTVARFAFDPAEAGEAVAGIPLLSEVVAQILDLHPVHIVGGVRDAPSEGFGPFDYGLYFTIAHLPEYDGTALSPGAVRTNLTFWGAPGDPAHNAERGRSCATLTLPIAGETDFCTLLPLPGIAPPASRPFLSNPTECTGQALVGTLNVYSQPQPGGGVFTDVTTDQTPTVIDRDDGTPKDGAQECQQLPFAPGVDVVPDVASPDSASGPEVKLSVPQDGYEDKSKFATAHIEDISVTLPPGLTINPSVANGLEACSDAQFAADVGEPGGEDCPPASRVGSVRAISRLLPPLATDPPDSTPVLTGSAYVGQPLPGEMYRLFVTVESRDLSVRLKGTVSPDSQTGQVSATFTDNPQLPFDELTVDVDGGPHAALATPLECGRTTATASLTPWSGNPPVAVQSAPFEIAGPGCPAPFSPGLGARTASSLAGAFSPFVARIARADGNQFLSGVTVRTPPGLAGMISRVEQCDDAAATSGACPASSRIGTATAAAGAGEPYTLSGPVYFTGPYKGAPFGMVAVIRAIAGPYDLGTVVVRQRIHVDPEDAHLTVVSDPLPTILSGVPIRLRTVEVALNKPGFVYNPTSCGEKRVDGEFLSTQGAKGTAAASFAVDGCERLDFRPRMSMRLIGPRQMKPNRHPGLAVTVRQPAGQANIGRARVSLPPSLALDPGNARSVCPYGAALRADCPASSRIGTATAVSPALNRPLKGPVYFVQGIRVDPVTGNRIRTLPSLLAKLAGEVRVNLRGTTEVEGSRRLVSTFEKLPDAPLSSFEMRLKGGSGGVLAVSSRRGLCGRRQSSRAELTGQNGKRSAFAVAMAKPCRRPRLKVRSVRRLGDRLVVRGTLARKARKWVAITARCGDSRVVKRAKRTRPGRWRAVLKLKGDCVPAVGARLVARYPGGGDFAAQAAARRVTF